MSRGAINIKDLPAEIRGKITKKAGVQREQIIRVAAEVVRAAASSGESLQVQRKGLELAPWWLKTR